MEFLIGGLAATSAGFFTNPLEVIKHHMELSKKSNMGSKPGSFLSAGYHVAKNNGFKSLQKGLSPAMGAHLVSYGMKLGKDYKKYKNTNIDVIHRSIVFFFFFNYYLFTF